MTLSDYVRRRNGVPLGNRDSTKNMLVRSLGAGTFSRFWQYWNPIWGYYLGKFVFKPIKAILPSSVSLALTFVVCGFIHDIVIMLIRWDFALIFTPWFLIMGVWLVISEAAKIDYSGQTWIIRAFINVLTIASCLLLAYQIRI